MSIGKQFISAVMAEGSVSNLLEHGPIDHLFLGSEEDAWNFVREFVKSYHALPKPETLESHTGTSLVPHAEPSGYYLDLMRARFTERKLKALMKDVQQKLLPEAYSPDDALAQVVEVAMSLVTASNAKQMADFREAYGVLVPHYVSKNHEEAEGGLMLGWPTVDKGTGGGRRGDVISYVGRPAAGKTFQMLFGAMFGWLENGVKFLETGIKPAFGQSRLFVSMEMALLPIQERMAAITTSLSLTKIKTGALGNSNFLGKSPFDVYKQGLAKLQGFPDPFWVMDGNLASTVDDIAMLARQLKPDAIFIDGAYLLKHPTERDRFRRVAENADLIKKELAPIAPVVCSWQFSRDATKKNTKKGQKVGLEDIGYTDAIGQVSSLVLGLFQEESVETLNQRKVEILKGRNGETGSFMTNWDFNKMDFTEIVEPDVDELQFL